MTKVTPKTKDKERKVKFSQELPSYSGKALYNKKDSGPLPVQDGVRLDCSVAAEDSEHELWLLQLPLDFNTAQKLEWEVRQDAQDGFRGRCTVQGQEFLLVPDSQPGPSQLYATPATPTARFVPVKRRLTVLRSTEAPTLCFGQESGIDRQQQGQGEEKQVGKADAAELKRKVKQEEQLVPAPAVPTLQQPRDSAAVPAAPNAATAAAPGSEGKEQQAMPVAAEAPEGGVAGEPGQEKSSERKKEKKEKKRKNEEGSSSKDAPGEQQAADKKHKKEKKDKKEKKEKKEKKKDKA